VVQSGCPDSTSLKGLSELRDIVAQPGAEIKAGSWAKALLDKFVTSRIAALCHEATPRSGISPLSTAPRGREAVGSRLSSKPAYFGSPTYEIDTFASRCY
jgi:hypothetical protein